MIIIASTFRRKQVKAMIIPTAEFDPLFANDGEPFQEKMLRYIKSEFADLLDGRRDLPGIHVSPEALQLGLETKNDNRSRHAA